MRWEVRLTILIVLLGIPILKDTNNNNSRKYINQPNHSINIFSGRDSLNIHIFKGMTIEKIVNKKTCTYFIK